MEYGVDPDDLFAPWTALGQEVARLEAWIDEAPRRGRPPREERDQIEQLLAQGVNPYRIARDYPELVRSRSRSFEDLYHAVRAVAQRFRQRTSS
jgi:hypothetical protein